MGGMAGIWLARAPSAPLLAHGALQHRRYMPPHEFWNARIKAVSDGGMEAIADARAGALAHAGVPRSASPDEASRVRDMIVATDPIGYAGCCAAIRDMDLRDLLGRS